jgi:hypothetical protein
VWGKGLLKSLHSNNMKFITHSTLAFIIGFPVMTAIQSFKSRFKCFQMRLVLLFNFICRQIQLDNIYFFIVNQQQMIVIQSALNFGERAKLRKPECLNTSSKL